MINYSDLLKKYKDHSLIPYQDLLGTEEWASKRELILERDKKTCQNCSRKAPSKFDFNDLKSKIGDVKKVSWRAVGKDRVYEEVLKEGYYWFMSEESMKRKPVFNEYRFLRTKSGFVLIPTLDLKYLKLHVHHKCYIEGYLPWEYDNKDLITLCEECHFKTHTIESVPTYRIFEGKLINFKYTPCYRCKGKGYLTQFWYHENGICYRCLGMKFEEFVKKII